MRAKGRDRSEVSEMHRKAVGTWDLRRMKGSRAVFPQLASQSGRKVGYYRKALLLCQMEEGLE
jgi:hypothetical protein